MNYLPNTAKTHILEFRNKEQPPLPVPAHKAQVIMDAMQNKNMSYIELSDDDGNFKELIEKREIKRIVRQTEIDDDNHPLGPKGWICDHKKWQPMSQGIFADEQGQKEWGGRYCACPEAPKKG